MMKRRKFLQTAGVASVVMSAGSLMALNRFPGMEDKKFTSEELKAALEKHYNEIISGKKFNPSVLPLNSRIYISNSFSIEINDTKNSIFDIADIVIERLKKSGFDATSLKKGEMPEKLNVGTGFVRIPESSFPINIKELTNYDATLSVQISGNIYTEILPEKWKEMTHFEEKTYQSKLRTFEGNINTKFFRMSFFPDANKSFDFKFCVDKINPEVSIIDFVPEIAPFNCLEEYFTKEQIEKIKN